jgi:quinol monooxygenase YgiN
MPLHFFAKLNPLPGKEAPFRDELIRVVAATHEEPGCIGIRAFESIHPPVLFTIHSEWVDEPAFELHVTLPHTVRFLAAANELLTHPVQGLRTHEIGADHVDTPEEV